MWAKALIVAFVVVVVLGITGAAFLSTRQQPTGGGSGPLPPPPPPPPPPEPILIEKAASQLVITLSDMEAGWLLVSEGEQTVAAEGFRDGYERVIARIESEFTTRAIYTTAWTFVSIDDADAYYSRLTQEVMASYSTEARTFGDEALYWEQTGDFINMLIRKSNVVWEISLFREGTFIWNPNIDWVSGVLVSKA